MAKEDLAAYRQKKTADPGGEQSTYPESDGLRPEALELLGYLAKEKE